MHDPVLVRQGDTYYILGTGTSIVVWASKDRRTWLAQPPVFAAPPAWASRAVPG